MLGIASRISWINGLEVVPLPTTISELVRANDALPPAVAGPLDDAVEKC